MKHIVGSVKIDSLSFREIPEILKGVYVKGNFDVSFNILRSLNNSPTKVDGTFKCMYNRSLKSLVGGPKEVGNIMVYNCSLRNLDEFPKINKANGHIDISGNQLTSLVGLPTTEVGQLSIYNNRGLKTLAGCPELVHGLLCQTDIKPKCEIIHNRDKNAVQNMLYIVETIFKSGGTISSFTLSKSLEIDCDIIYII